MEAPMDKLRHGTTEHENRWPSVEVLPADPQIPNPANPFEQASPSERWAARARILSSRMATSWTEAVKHQAMHEEMIEMDGEPLIKAKEAWEHMKVSERAFYRFVRSTRIPTYRIGRMVRYKWSEIEQVIRLGTDATP